MIFAYFKIQKWTGIKQHFKTTFLKLSYQVIDKPDQVWLSLFLKYLQAEFLGMLLSLWL